MDNYQLQFIAECNGESYIDFEINTEHTSLKELQRFKAAITDVLKKAESQLKAAAPHAPPETEPELEPIPLPVLPVQEPIKIPIPKKQPLRQGVRGLLGLECKSCGQRFWKYVREETAEVQCNCGGVIRTDGPMAYFDAMCHSCGQVVHGWTNIEDATFQCRCNNCRTMVDLIWDKHTKEYGG